MALDLLLLRLINVELANPLLDRVIPFFSKLSRWEEAIAVAAVLILLKEGKRGLLIFGGVALVLLLSEGLSSGVLKPLVDRTRPCHLYPWVRLLGAFCPKSPAFTSSHAANMFALTTFLSFFFPRLRWPLLGLASLVSLSRVYVGVHYPFDVLGGALLGVGCAWAVKSLLERTLGFLGYRDVFRKADKGHRASGRT